MVADNLSLLPVRFSNRATTSGRTLFAFAYNSSGDDASPVPDKYLQPRIFGDLIQGFHFWQQHHTFPIVSLARLQKSHQLSGEYILPGGPQLFTVVVVPLPISILTFLA